MKKYVVTVSKAVSFDTKDIVVLAESEAAACELAVARASDCQFDEVDEHYEVEMAEEFFGKLKVHQVEIK